MSIPEMILLGVCAVVFLLVERRRDKDQKDFIEWQRKRHEEYLKKMLNIKEEDE